MNDVDRAVLAIEKRYYRYGGMKLNAIAAETGLTPSRYAQRLVWLLSDREAWEADPVLMKRLQRVVDVKRRSAA